MIYILRDSISVIIKVWHYNCIFEWGRFYMNKFFLIFLTVIFLSSLEEPQSFSQVNTSKGTKNGTVGVPKSITSGPKSGSRNGSTGFEFHQTEPQDTQNANIGIFLRLVLPIYRNQRILRARACGHFYQSAEDVFDSHSGDREYSYQNPDYRCHCISMTENNALNLDFVTCLGIDSGAGFCSREGTLTENGNQLCLDNLGGPDPSETCPNPMATGAVLLDDAGGNTDIDTHVCTGGTHLLCIKEEYQGVAADRCFNLAADNMVPSNECTPDTTFPKVFQLAPPTTAINVCYLGKTYSTTIRNAGSGRTHYCMVNSSRVMDGMSSQMESCFGNTPDGKKVCLTNISEPANADRCDLTVDLR